MNSQLTERVKLIVEKGCLKLVKMTVRSQSMNLTVSLKRCCNKALNRQTTAASMEQVEEFSLAQEKELC